MNSQRDEEAKWIKALQMVGIVPRNEMKWRIVRYIDDEFILTQQDLEECRALAKLRSLVAKGVITGIMD
jgi:hypothetical protein